MFKKLIEKLKPFVVNYWESLGHAERAALLQKIETPLMELAALVRVYRLAELELATQE